MKNVKSFEEFLLEQETSKYTPPKYAVSPSLAQDGSGEIDDKMQKYMEDELRKRKPYFKPGIKSANPPIDMDEEKLNLNN